MAGGSHCRLSGTRVAHSLSSSARSERAGRPRAGVRPEGDRAPVMVAERSEGTARGARRDLNERRARTMGDRTQRRANEP